MPEQVTVAMVALGGYGNFYLRALMAEATAHHVKLVAGVDPNPVGCRHLDYFEREGIPIYPDLDHFYAEMRADLVFIAAPIHLHAPFTQTALNHGSHVLCEKPLTATLQVARQMAEAQAAAGKFVGVGYQWSYAEAIQALKRDVLDGVLGRPLRFRTKVLWPRPASYFARNTWAGHRKAKDGTWVLDSPAHNATGHYLHNCFYVLGNTRETSAWPIDVQAELYRANSIQNFDAAALRAHTEAGVEILFYTAHPVRNNIGPVLRYEFEEVVVEYDDRGSHLLAKFHDGRVKDYGDPFANDANKLWQAAEAVRSGAPLACGIEAATPQVLCINGAQESMWEIVDFPPDLVRKANPEGDPLTWVAGLQESFEDCYARGILPSEDSSLMWAKAGKVIDLRDYDHFPMFH